jgi:raffinose/stachyose/melibiose transport system permease protein
MSAVLGAAPGSRSATTVMPKWLQGHRLTRPMFYLVLSGLALYSLAPLAIVVFTSLKSEIGLAQNPIGPPVHPQWDNFVQAWQQGSIGVGMENSAILTLGTIAGVCVIAGCAAYAMARLDLPGTNAVIVYLIFTSALPIQLFLVPLFFLWSKLHLYNTLFGVIIIYWAIFSPFATLLLRSFMMSIPRDYEEAARVDGASEIKVMWKVTLRLVSPGLLTVALISGLSAWNNFLIAITFLQSPSVQPVSAALYAFQQGFSSNYTLIAAAGILMLLPMMLLFLALQRHFVAGIASGGLGGA